MSVRAKLRSLVEEKIGDKINLEIAKSWENGKILDIESYAKTLIEDVFNSEELEKLQSNFPLDSDVGSDFSYDNIEEDFVDHEGEILDFSIVFSSDVTSEDQNVLKELLQSLEFQTTDEVVGQSEWPQAKKALQNLLLTENNRQLQMLSLKIFKRLLASTHSPRVVCEGFISLNDAILSQIESIKKGTNTIEAEDLYDIRGSKVFHRSSHRRGVNRPVHDGSLETLTMSMHLVLSAHNNVPAVWVRFNERRLHDVIFSFIDMLSHSFTLEKNSTCGLDIVSWLQPRANWAQHWAHSATARTLLCRALRKHTRFFQALVDITVEGVVTLLPGKPRRRSAGKLPDISPTDASASDDVTLLDISIKSMAQARFCHSFAILTHLLQYRAGRALFPLMTSLRRRPWTAHDMVALMVDYTERAQNEKSLTPTYVHHIRQMAQILAQVEQEILTARGTKRRN